MIVQCGYCGTDVKRKPHEVEKYKKHFCDNKCRGRSQQNRLRFTCENCGIEFESWPSRGSRRCCSWECYFGFRKGQAKGYIQGGGYRMIYLEKSHPLGERVYEHWLVMYKHDPGFTVWAKENRWSIHHRNGVRDDNRPENLEWKAPGKHGSGIEVHRINAREFLSVWYRLLAERS